MRYINKVTGREEKREDIPLIVSASISYEDYLDVLDEAEEPIELMGERYGYGGVADAMMHDMVVREYESYLETVALDIINGEEHDLVPIEIAERMG